MRTPENPHRPATASHSLEARAHTCQSLIDLDLVNHIPHGSEATHSPMGVVVRQVPHDSKATQKDASGAFEASQVSSPYEKCGRNVGYFEQRASTSPPFIHHPSRISHSASPRNLWGLFGFAIMARISPFASPLTSSGTACVDKR